MRDKIVLLVSGVIIIILNFNDCRGISFLSFNQPVSAPSRNLSATELFYIEGINSLHYVMYYSDEVNGESDSMFKALAEYLVDSEHSKIIQYYLDNHNYYITVYNLQKNISWNNYLGTITYPQLPNLYSAHEDNIQSLLGSSLQSPTIFIRTENLDGKLCNVFSDSLGSMEWVWIEHKFPIQHRIVGKFGINTIRKKIITINEPIPDSIFEAPK